MHTAYTIWRTDGEYKCIHIYIYIYVLEIWGLRACKVPLQSGNALQEVCVCVSVSAKGMQCVFVYGFVRFKIVCFFGQG